MLGHEEIMSRADGHGPVSTSSRSSSISSRNGVTQLPTQMQTEEQTHLLTLADTLPSLPRSRPRSRTQSQAVSSLSSHIEQQDARTRTPSPTFPPLTEQVPEFSPDASILLVGMRGSGKSTLAVMAHAAMNRKVMDMESVMMRTTGLSSASYKAQHGPCECYRQQAKLLQTVMERHPTGAIIVCWWMESRVQRLFREFAATNPVIHIVRDADAIQKYLRFKVLDSVKFRNLFNISGDIFRTCTNFEFFNVSEKLSKSKILSSQESLLRSPAPFLTLKHVERHFLKFLSLIFPAGTIPFLDSAFPLARIPVEERQFTYATSIPLSDILNEQVDVEDHVTGADVVQIVVHDLAEAAESNNLTNDVSIKLKANITRGIGIVRRGTILPIILHIFLPHTANEEVLRVYLELIHHAARLAPEMMTVDLRLEDAHITRFVAAQKRTKVIGNCFIVTDPPSWDSPAWLTWYRKATALGCHLARLIRPASVIEDNFRIDHLRSAVDALEGHKIPLITYNSGPLGRTSAVFNRILTVVRPESLERVTPKAPITPSLTAAGATRALYSSFVYNQMKLYVVGANVSYSLSPAMHRKALAVCAIPHTYEPVSCDSLSGIRHLIADPNFGGASVGLPFKVEVIALTHSLSNHAKAIGAVNTLIPIRTLNPDGTIPTGAAFFQNINQPGPVKALYGENTDWIGIRACIRRGLSPANAVVPTTCGLIIGAGGMARATFYAMLQIGIKNIVIYNRTVANAEKLVSHFRQLLEREDFKLLSAGREAARFHIIESLEETWPEEFRLPTVVVSCIPTHRIGDVPAPELVLPENWIGSRSGGVAIDLGYKTLTSPFIQQFKEEASRGWVSMDGLDMLPDQGFAQFELFTGRRPSRKLMRREVLQAYPKEDESVSQELQPRLQSLDDEEES